MQNNNNANVQFIIIGSGIAGMSTALHLSKLGNVTLYTKSKLISGSTPLAQGGIAGVIDAKDSFENHIQDTMKAGGYANNTQAVELLVHRAPEEIKFLHKIGVQFEKDQHLEGGHSFPRVSKLSLEPVRVSVITSLASGKPRVHEATTFPSSL